MELYRDNGCKCKDSDQICSHMKYIAVHKKSIQKVKDGYNLELTVFKVFGKIILGKEISDILINNWAKTKLYYCKCLSEITIQSMKVVKAKNILQSFDSMGKVDQDLKQGKNLLILTYSLYMQGAKTLLFDKESEDSKRILIASNSHSIFNNFNIQSITKTEFIEILQKVYHNMGTSYTPVRITSGYRTNNHQAKIMSQMLPSNGMLKLYKGVSKPYIELVQILYNEGRLAVIDTKYNEKFDYWCLALPNDQYNAIGDKYNENPYIIYQGNMSLCQALLSKIFDEGVCIPSFHQVGQAFDLSPKTETVLKASSLYRNDKQMVRENYIHFTLD